LISDLRELKLELCCVPATAAKSTTDLDWDDYVGFVVATYGDRMLGLNKLSVHTQVHECSCDVMEASSEKLYGLKSKMCP
jgi:hypothetical protein